MSKKGVVSIFVGNKSVSFYDDDRWSRHYTLTPTSKRRLLGLRDLVTKRQYIEYRQSGRYLWRRGR